MQIGEDGGSGGEGLKVLVHMRRVNRLLSILPMFSCVPGAQLLFSVPRSMQDLTQCQEACSRAARSCNCTMTGSDNEHQHMSLANFASGDGSLGI